MSAAVITEPEVADENKQCAKVINRCGLVDPRRVRGEARVDVDSESVVSRYDASTPVNSHQHDGKLPPTESIELARDEGWGNPTFSY
jgi:hypothetical protein